MMDTITYKSILQLKLIHVSKKGPWYPYKTNIIIIRTAWEEIKFHILRQKQDLFNVTGAAKIDFHKFCFHLLTPGRYGSNFQTHIHRSS